MRNNVLRESIGHVEDVNYSLEATQSGRFVHKAC